MQWKTLDCYHKTYGADGTLDRGHRGEVIPTSRLLPTLRSLNPDTPDEALIWPPMN